jgi:7-cyano-7-deazaguanine synthase
MKFALLLSGGMDSLCLAWWLKPEVAITVDYGQLAAAAEVEASSQVCALVGSEHHILRIDCRSLGSGDMAGTTPHESAPASDWWPYRNQMLLTFGAMRAVALGVDRLLIGCVATDAAHADGSPRFIERISALLGCQEGSLSVEAPAIGMTTVELVEKSGVPLDMLALAHSCHRASVPCGRCRGCNKYFETMHALGA